MAQSVSQNNPFSSMHTPPQPGSLVNTWNMMLRMPLLVLPQPVLPRISQPRQNSLRSHVSPLSTRVCGFLTGTSVICWLPSCFGFAPDVQAKTPKRPNTAGAP